VSRSAGGGGVVAIDGSTMLGGEAINGSGGWTTQELQRLWIGGGGVSSSLSGESRRSGTR
jgi:hypothetical protein